MKISVSFTMVAMTVLVSTLLGQVAEASTLRHAVRFEQPRLTTKGTVSTIELAGLPASTEPARAMLPFKPLRLLVPHGHLVSSVSVTVGERTIVGRDISVAKAPAIGPLSLLGRRRQRFLKLYPTAPMGSMQRVYPPTHYGTRGVQRLHGYCFVDLNLYPLQYDVSQRTLYATDEMTVTLELVTDSNPPPFSNRPAVRTRLTELVANPEVLESYQEGVASYDRPLDYLIISTEAIAAIDGTNSLPDFVEFLATRGVSAEIHTVEALLHATNEEIPATERLRKCIRQCYDNRGIRYVLLAGDAHRDGDGGIPAPTLYAEFVWEGRQFRADLAADIYYSLLDGELDHDGDGHCGEAVDGTDGGEIDLYAEVAIGRLPIDDAQQLRRLIGRTKAAYAIADLAERRQILFAGENLFPGVWGRQYMEELEFGTDSHGFATVGVPAQYAVDHLFDLGNRQRRWNGRDLIDKLNGTCYQLHHVGHSATWMTMRCYGSTLSGLQSAPPFLVYTQGCHGGRFTVDDCIIEKFMLCEHGAFACLANSHYGLGPEDPDDDETVLCRGASQYFHRQFLHSFWQGKASCLGELNQRSKEANIPFMHHGTTRWVFFEMNLLGDPMVELIR